MYNVSNVAEGETTAKRTFVYFIKVKTILEDVHSGAL